MQFEFLLLARSLGGVLVALSFACPASATTVLVMSVSDTTAQVVVNRSAIHVLRIGETSPEGVKLADIQDRTAVLEFDRKTYRMGIGATTTAEAVIRMSPGGAYAATAFINGVAVPAMIDTGASDVSLTTVHARQLGIDYSRGRRGVAQTANGPVEIFFVTLPSVQVGDIVVKNVRASVAMGAQAATLREVLIGNSFLRHVQMQRSGDTMILMRGNGI
jgi:aspartyl protease family protein